MSGAELKKTVRNFVEGYQGGFNPFNRGSLPVVSGISVEIKETDDGYTLSKVTKNGKSVQDKDTFTVTCLATKCVLKGDAVLAKPEDYMTLR